MSECIHGRVLSWASLALASLCFLLGGQARAAEFYLTTDIECAYEGIVELPVDQVSDWELCLESTVGYDTFLAGSFDVAVTGDILIDSWVSVEGVLGSPSTDVNIFGSLGLNPTGFPSPVHIGTIALDVGPWGGDVYASSDGQDLTEQGPPGFLHTELDPVVVPEPAAVALQAIMLLSLSALGLLRRSSSC